MIRCTLLILLLLHLPFGGFLRGGDNLPPPPRRHFNDYAGVIAPAAANRLDAQLQQCERDRSNQIVVAVFARLESSDPIEAYTLRVARSWQVGQRLRNNGVVLFVFKEDRKLHIQVGTGLEGALPDALCKGIIDTEIIPHFRAQNYAAGLAAGIDALIAATRGEYKGEGSTAVEQPFVRHVSRIPRGGGASVAPWKILVGLIVFVLLLRWILHSQGMVFTGSGRRSTWYHSHDTGNDNGWGGLGGSGGGFSGGGGSFGGGGAGGSW